MVDHVDYERLHKEAAARRAKGEMVGLGIAYFVEKSGLGPDDLVRMSLDKSGAVEIVTGVASVGQGVETVLAQICAETLDIPIKRITVVHAQTARNQAALGPSPPLLPTMPRHPSSIP